MQRFTMRQWRRWLGRGAGAFVAAFAIGSASLAALLDLPLAPDGRRGFGAQTAVNDVLAAVRSNAEPERAFRNELDNLASEIKVLTALARQQYEQAHYFDVLELQEEHGLDVLHARFAILDADPLPVLSNGGPKARALAAMMLDTRFRVRAQVLEDVELELRELEQGLRVLRAATDGYVLFSQNEMSNVTTRIDTSASLLRAVRNDLRALREQSGPTEVDPALLERILAATKASEGEGVRRALIDREREQARKLQALMASALFTTRLRPQLLTTLIWRAGILEESRKLVEEAERALPEHDAKAPPDPKLAELSKSDRIRRAGYIALQAMQQNPLDETGAWLVAHAAEFQYGLLESRPWYDRYLALRRIRFHDHRTYADRKLSARELEALEAVQREIVPGQPRQRGL
jgi:hypothetical protein